MGSKSASRLIHVFAYLVVIALIGLAVWFGQPYWNRLHGESVGENSRDHETEAVAEEPSTLEIGKQARANLSLVSAPVQPQTYWTTLLVPGVIEDRPGITDRGITAPIAGVITQVHAFEGDIIRPGERLFTLRLVSEYLQQSQSDLFKAIREVEILNQEINRIENLIDAGTLPGKRRIELEQQVSRENARIDAYRQDLISRGLSPEQVKQVESGQFLTSIDVSAPMVGEESKNISVESLGNDKTNFTPPPNIFFEIQNLTVDLGQQVDAGQALAVLANHNSLYIKGHAFKKEAARVARAAEKSWNVKVEFTEDTSGDWAAIDQPFRIRHLSNTTDPNSRTFDFFIPLENQLRVYEKEGRPFVIWRFRPGQRVNISVPVEQIEDVLVVPASAVAFEGPKAFVFQQNGDLFHRLPVQVVHRDRYNVVLANNGAIAPGFYLAQNAAESLNRVLKAQASSGMQPGVHMHADGTVHASH
ncbi:MAG: efflux RND transporter periplasmic adaptor subunit [Pirellulaceae bacterium]